MTKAQKRLRDLRDRQSKERQRMAELSREDSLTVETRAELDRIENGTPDLERQIRAAAAAVEDDERDAKIDQGRSAPDAEQRERIELRSRAAVGRYVSAAMRGRLPDGAESELSEAAGLEAGQIPFELWQRPAPETREDRAVSAAPGTVGVNLDVLRPYVFAPSVVDQLQVAMPSVGSGTFASGTISTAVTADAVAKGGAGTDGEVPETAAEFTVQTTTPHRIGASLRLSLEDIASVGQENFESILRQHISLAVSDELDSQMLNGDGTDDDLTGFFARLSAATAPGAAVATFDDFVSVFSDGVDGLWATQISQVAVVCGVSSYRISAKTFRDPSTGTAGGRGAMSFADYARKHTAGWFTNRRMPAAAANIQNAILCRKGRSAMMPMPMRTAVCPHWGHFQVDDVYTGASKGQRRFVINTLVGDVILVQPDAYAQVAFRTAV